MLTARCRRGGAPDAEDMVDADAFRYRDGDVKDSRNPPPPPPPEDVEAPEETEVSKDAAVGDRDAALPPPPNFRLKEGVLLGVVGVGGVGGDPKRSREDAEEERRFCLGVNEVGDVGLPKS